MSEKVTLGGDRLGTGNKMQVELKQYSKSNHDLSYLWRSTMAAGTLVPFMSEVALPGDTFNIDLQADILTHPTIGPLFGSYKVQLDVFQCPIRLYNALLHNNKLGIGLDMSQVKLPAVILTAKETTLTTPLEDFANTQINPSTLLAYFNIRGVGVANAENITRSFNGTPFLAYWDIYKNYYANKQEGTGAYIFTPPTPIQNNITSINKGGTAFPFTLNAKPTINTLTLVKTNPENIDLTQYFLKTEIGDLRFSDIGTIRTENATTATFNVLVNTTINATGFRPATTQELLPAEVKIQTFPLTDVDEMRNLILQWQYPNTPFNINLAGISPTLSSLNPYKAMTELNGLITPYETNQQCLALKTYQSDLFNNWLDTENINNINQQSSISVEDNITIDQINLAHKVYQLLNSIATTGGSYSDWLKAVYNSERIRSAETPIYCGGLIKELIFQEITSNSAATNGDTTQPLGTLAGRGKLSAKHKGGRIKISVDEPSYIIGLISLTPRVDYSQGNKWDMNLETLDDLHKPALDQIGFQELITEQMAWFGTSWDGGGWIQKSAGKQPSWINYMTNVNQVRGNFAIKSNEMFMTLNRDYEVDKDNNWDIKDITTYIDPSKFNHIFAETSRDAQNFWAQVGINLNVRRKMSAKQIPSL